jgi:hypothetical protein
MRPTVAAFCVLALGVLVAMGNFVLRLLRDEPPAEPETVAQVEAPPPEARPDEPSPVHSGGLPAGWLSSAKQKSRSTPKFDPSVYERVRAVEKLREQSRQDGFLFREAGSDKVFVVQRGTKFAVANETELQKLGFKSEQVREVPPGAMDHLSSRPPDRSLLRDRDDPRIFFFENGVKRWVSDAGAFNRHGFDWGAVRVIPSGSLSAYDTGDPIQ